MPKDDIDYSNTIIYKIYCKDESIKDVYVGHTTNFSQRKYSHRIACNKEKENDLKIYKVIRQNGGWKNWDMIEIAKYNCKNSTEARIKEHEHYKELNASLNSIPPYVDFLNYYCKDCNKQCNSSSEYKIHLKSKLHIKGENKILEYPVTEKNPNYVCEKCKFNTRNKKDYNKHLITAKHMRITQSSQDFLKKTQLDKSHVKSHLCICGKNYKYNQGLWKHQKTCSFKNKPDVVNELIPTSESEIKILTNLVLDVVKQNQELTNKIIDICKINQPTIANTISNSNVNSNNKTFNLQFFLNETCKNAMNMTQFVDSLQLQLSDLEEVGKLGYVEGISNIIVKNLNALDITQRPIHCADKKREVIYIKDEDKWEKEDAEKNKMKQLIKKVAYKNERLLPKYKELHPGCNYSESKYADHYSKLVIEAMGGAGNNDAEKEEKIMRKIAKEVVIDKSFGLTD